MIVTKTEMLPRIEGPNDVAACVWDLQRFVTALSSASADSPRLHAMALQYHDGHERWDKCVSLLSIIEQSGVMLARILEAESLEAGQPWQVPCNRCGNEVPF